MENNILKNSRAFAPKSGFPSQTEFTSLRWYAGSERQRWAKNISISVSVLEVG